VSPRLRTATGAALALAAVFAVRPLAARAGAQSVEEQNTERAKSGLLPRKLPPREPPPPEIGPPPPPAVQAAAAPARPPAPRRLGPLDGAVAAARGLSAPGAQDGADARLDGLAAQVAGLQVRSAVRVRAGDVSLVVEQDRRQ